MPDELGRFRSGASQPIAGESEGDGRPRLRYARGSTAKRSVAAELVPEDGRPSGGTADRIGFLYSWDWSHEFRDYLAGRVPAHRLFGAGQLGESGMVSVHCTWGWCPSRLRKPGLWRVWQGLWAVLSQRHLAVLVATTEASALVPLLFRRLGVLRRPVVTVSVAILRFAQEDGRRSRLRAWLLGRSDLVLVYSSAQVTETARWLGIPEDRVRFVPLGIDTDFFSPRPAPATDGRPPEVLSVGTNEGKDYPTLLAALGSGQDCLIVTDPGNAAIVGRTPTKGSVRLAHDLGIVDLRELYSTARHCVIPLRDTRYSSGQTVLLELMAMGAPVTVSDVPAVRDYVQAEGVAVVVPAGDPAALRAVLAAEPAVRPRASAHVGEHFSSRRFSRDLATVCRELGAIRIGGGR